MIVGLFRSDGGVPKQPVDVAVVTPVGMTGDRQNDVHNHGGPDRALCLYSRERLNALHAEGHPIEPGMIGENVLVEGLDWDVLVPGMRLDLGAGAEIEITDYTHPCKTIAAAFADGYFTRISHKVHPGWSRLYARVRCSGEVRVGDRVRIHSISDSPRPLSNL